MREVTPREPSSKVDPRLASPSLLLEVASRAASEPPRLPLLLRLPLRTPSGGLLRLPLRTPSGELLRLPLRTPSGELLRLPLRTLSGELLRLPRRGLTRLRCWGDREEGGP